jgi:DNA-3-methyladenine glycosylase II
MDTHHAAIDALTATHPDLAAVVALHGRPPVFRRPATFATLVLLILEQQVSLSSAAAAFRRLETAGPVTPEGVLALDDDTLRTAGFSRQKARYARELARAVRDSYLDLDGFASSDDDHVRAALMAVPGIGPWTADIFLMSCLGRPDVWPIGDRALQVGTAEALDLSDVPQPTELSEIGARWAPLRSTAALIIWHGYLGRRNRLPLSG